MSSPPCYTASIPPSYFPLECGCEPTASAICSAEARRFVTPLIVVALFKAYSVGGVLSFMIGLLVIQIGVVSAWGIEPAKRGLETLDTVTGDVAPRAMQADD